MVMDRNPRFNDDVKYAESAPRVAEMLWEASEGNLASIPSSYLANLKHEYEDGSISMIDLIDRLDLPKGASWDEYCEAVDYLLKVDPSQWPNKESILEIQTSKLDYEIEAPQVDFDEAEFQFAEPDDLSTKIENFFKKVIASVYLDGVSEVSDAEGNPPNADNNYLMAEDGSSFSGVFYDRGGEEEKSFPFTIMETSSGKWSIKY